MKQSPQFAYAICISAQNEQHDLGDDLDEINLNEEQPVGEEPEGGERRVRLMVLDLDEQILNFDLLARSTWEVSKVRAEEASMARDRLTQEGILFRDNNLTQAHRNHLPNLARSRGPIRCFNLGRDTMVVGGQPPIRCRHCLTEGRLTEIGDTPEEAAEHLLNHHGFTHPAVSRVQRRG